MNAEALWCGALALHADHRTIEAEALYRKLLDQDPGHVGALSMLAIILIDGPDDAEVEAVILRHLALIWHQSMAIWVWPCFGWAVRKMRWLHWIAPLTSIQAMP